MGPAVRVAPPWRRWGRRCPRASAQCRRLLRPLLGGRKSQRPPHPIAVASHLPAPPPGQPGGRAPSASGAWGHLAPMPRRGGCPSFWEGPRPVRRRGAQVREGLGGRAGPPMPRGQRGRSRAPVLRDEYLTSRRDPGQVPRTAWAHRGVGVSLVAREQWLMPPAQASAPSARCPMLQAERALRATARPRWAAALRGYERDASGRRPWGPPNVRE